MHNDNIASHRSSVAGFLVRLILSRRSMVVLDAAIIVLGACTMIYSILRFFNVIGTQPFIEDCNFTLDVFTGMADVFVFYGVALESRSHLLRTVLRREGDEETPDEKLDHSSEYAGVILVVLGLLLELTAQVGNLVADGGLDDWTFFPMCLFGFVLVGITLQQLVLHFIATLRHELGEKKPAKS